VICDRRPCRYVARHEHRAVDEDLKVGEGDVAEVVRDERTMRPRNRKGVCLWEGVRTFSSLSRVCEVRMVGHAVGPGDEEGEARQRQNISKRARFTASLHQTNLPCSSWGGCQRNTHPALRMRWFQEEPVQQSVVERGPRPAKEDLRRSGSSDVQDNRVSAAIPVGDRRLELLRKQCWEAATRRSRP
jgi:hypothetical protein